MSHRPNNPRALELRARARRMRFAPTASEWAAWQLLRSRRCGVLFRRQVVIGQRIADFACARLKLVVEVDGPYHSQQVGGDRRRDRELERAGYRVLRLPAELVLQQPLVARQRVVEVVAELEGHG